jgi:hypothetical protein
VLRLTLLLLLLLLLGLLLLLARHAGKRSLGAAEGSLLARVHVGSHAAVVSVHLLRSGRSSSRRGREVARGGGLGGSPETREKVGSAGARSGRSVVSAVGLGLDGVEGQRLDTVTSAARCKATSGQAEAS